MRATAPWPTGSRKSRKPRRCRCILPLDPTPRSFHHPWPTHLPCLILYNYLHLSPASISFHTLPGNKRGFTSQVCSYWLQHQGGRGYSLGSAPEELEELYIRACSEFLAESCGGQVLGGAEKPIKPQDPMASLKQVRGCTRGGWGRPGSPGSPPAPPGGIAHSTLSCLPLKGTRDVTAKVANHLDKVTTMPLELVPEQKVP